MTLINLSRINADMNQIVADEAGDRIAEERT
jgi:hypothetical protein